MALLSRRSLESVTQLSAIHIAMKAKLKVVGVSVPSFNFPGDTWYEEHLQRLLPESHEEAVHTIQLFFNRITVAFDTNALDNVLETQSALVLGRLQPSKLEKSSTILEVHVQGQSSTWSEPNPELEDL